MERRWLCSAATLRGDRATNQDQAVVVDGAAAVLDGATSWLRDPADQRDGGWYARVLGGALAARLPGTDPLPAVLADAIAHVRGAHSLVPGDSPYSTASILRWSADLVEVLVLGDSPALVETEAGVEVVADERLAGTAAEERSAYREWLAAGAGFDPAFGGLIAAVQRRERESFNRAGGFWVAEAEPAAAYQAVTRTWPTHEVVAAALMSDGVSCAVTDYSLLDWADVLPVVAADGGAAAWLAGLHEIEAGDPDGRRWPRTKRHDDKTLVIVRDSFSS